MSRLAGRAQSFLAVLFAVSTAAVLLDLGPLALPASAATPTFKQVNASTPQTPQSVVATTFGQAQSAGDLNVVVVGWNQSTGTINSVVDSKGNAYQVAAPIARGSGLSQAVYYAKNIAAATAGGNTVTVTFSGAMAYPDIRILEYGGIDTAGPFDVTASASGSASTANSGAVTTHAASELLLGAGITGGAFSAAGTGYTSRIITTDGDIAEDRTVTAAGSYSATAPVKGSWLMQLVAFKTDAGGPDTTPPSVPAGLTAQAVSSTQVSLNWTASTDNVGVTGYRLYRNGTLVNTVTVTPVQDAGLTPGTTYAYAVSAIDAAGNESAQSAAVQVTTPAPDNTPPSVSMTAPANGTTVSGAVTVSATASDSGSGVHDVEFLLDGVTINDDLTAPYTYAWDSTTTANGVHQLAARAHDNAGNFSNTSGAFTVTVNNQAGQLPADLMAGYPFTESTGTTTADVTGFGNTATFNSLANPIWTAGKYGSGLKFDGTAAGYLSINDSATMNITGNALTLSMWINPSGGQPGDGVVFGKFWNGTGNAPYYQYGLEISSGLVPSFYIGTTAGTSVGASMGSALPLGQWSHLAIAFDGTHASYYVNGTLVSSPSLAGSIAGRTGSTTRMGTDLAGTQGFKGSLDDVRLYKRVESQADINTDKNTALAAGGSGLGPSVAITAPAQNAQVSSIVTITADAADAVGVQFFVDGTAAGAEDTAAPYAANWDTRAAANGAHTITARARDDLGHTTVSNPVTVNVSNSDTFQNEILATGLDLPTAMKFLPDGRMLVAELMGKIRILPPPYTSVDPTPFLQIPTNVEGVQEGIFDFALDPGYATNRYFYVYYTAPNSRDRLSRFTANASSTGTIAGSEFVLFEDPANLLSNEHHGGAINFSNDGKILLTTGDQFQGTPAKDLTSPYGKILRLNMDGSAPTDNPFYDGAGPNWDSIWALGLRNPYRASYDAPTGRLILGDVGGNVYTTAYEEVDVGARGANYGWPDCEVGTCGNPNFTPAAYAYAHAGRDAAVTGGFVYRNNGGANPFPSGMEGSYFFADYAQNWIKRLTFDGQGNVSGVFNFEPASGILDGPYGDIVYLTEGPDGSLYYLDLGYSDVTGTFGISKIRRIRYQSANQAPSAVATADVTSGPTPLAVNFSSAGSSDPEGQPLTYSWDFGDGTPLSSATNPAHTYPTAGTYTVRLTVSDGVNNTFSPPVTIRAGSPPTATISAPTDGATFRGGDVITFSGDATDPVDGTLPASAFTWNVDFLHEGHVHPGSVATGVKTGSFVIPTTGHDFSGNTRYRITLTVTNSSGLTSTKTVVIWPQKVNLSFDTVPSGLTLYLDGIAKTTPFVYDTLVNFQHTVEARNQTVANTNYTFASWSDGGAQQHTIVVPAADRYYAATFTGTNAAAGPSAAWGFNEGSGATAADATGHGNTATLVGSPAWVAGKHGTALSLNGTNNYVSLANSSTLDIAGNALGLDLWLNPATVAGDSVVLGKFYNAGMTSPYYQYGLELSGGKPSLQIGTATGVVGATMDTALSANQWSHLAVVFNGTQVQFYVNGTLVSTKPLTATITARGKALYLGADASPWQFFKGSLDDVRLYNRTLTPAEITADMNTGL